jgi:hypothetical protein
MPRIATLTSSKRRPRENDEQPSPSSPALPVLGSHSHVLSLQRSAGNRAVSELLQSGAGLGGGRLRISQPDDNSEREAESVAARVSALLVRPLLQREAEHGTATTNGATSAGILNNLGSGQPLDPSTRDSMESRFGTDFSPVRVHAGTEAAQAARSVDARAFTIGRDVVFGESEYQPHTNEGQRLLAHELTHVVQQSAGPLMVQRAVTLTNDDYKSLADQIHTALGVSTPAGFLNTDEEAIHAALQKLEKDATAIGELKKVYKTEHKSDLEADIRAAMSEEELTLALELIGVKDVPKSADVVGTVPATDDEYKKVARKLYAAMNIFGTDEEAIYGLLMPFKRDSTTLTKLRTIYQSELSGGLTGTGLEDDIRSEMSGDELAYALFLLNAPLTGPASAGPTVTAAGTEAHKATLPGGEVSVKTGAEIKVGGTTFGDTYTVGYKGGRAADSNWVQFIWSEVLATQADGSVKYVDEKGLPTTNGTMDLTTDPAAPKYKVDAGASDPFYATIGVDIRKAAETTILDRPFEFSNVIKRAFDAGATKVVERDHFDDFLVRDYKSIYHLSLYVEWEYTSKTAFTRSTKFGSGAKVDGMPSEMRDQLVKEYPKFDYIQ